MPAVFVITQDVVNSDMAGQTPWPDDVQLFQPDEVTQILLPDSANCLSVQAYLKMCQLKYKVVYKHNAEYMSPSGEICIKRKRFESLEAVKEKVKHILKELSEDDFQYCFQQWKIRMEHCTDREGVYIEGKVPFIKSGAFLVSELEGVVSHVQSKEISLTGDLDNIKKADMRAFISLVNNVLLNAELFITWCDPGVYQEVTWKRYASVYPFPLNYVLTWRKRQQAIKRLKALGWYSKTLEDVYVEVETCCKALSDRLEDEQFFFGDKPTELDALVFAHVFTIISTPLPTNKFPGIIRCFPNIVEHCKRIEKIYFTPV